MHPSIHPSTSTTLSITFEAWIPTKLILMMTQFEELPNVFVRLFRCRSLSPFPALCHSCCFALCLSLCVRCCFLHFKLFCTFSEWSHQCSVPNWNLSCMLLFSCDCVHRVHSSLHIVHCADRIDQTSKEKTFYCWHYSCISLYALLTLLILLFPFHCLFTFFYLFPSDYIVDIVFTFIRFMFFSIRPSSFFLRRKGNNKHIFLTFERYFFYSVCRFSVTYVYLLKCAYELRTFYRVALAAAVFFVNSQ